MPRPEISQAINTAPSDADCAMFCGRLNTPPPTIALMTIKVMATRPSFTLPFETACELVIVIPFG